MTFSLAEFLFIALAVGSASGAIGSFIVLKRMALVGDALSHVALPGIALALILAMDPFWGVLVFLLGAAFLIWWLEGRTRLYADAIVGLLFTTSLALGVLFIPNVDLLESLFGAFPHLSLFEFLFVVCAAAITGFLAFFFAKRFLFSIISPELSQVRDERRMADLILLLIFSCTVALGIKLVGTLLMGALTVIPAAIAKNTSRSTSGYIVASALLGAAISLGGAFFSYRAGVLPGPTIILFGVALFFLSLFKKPIFDFFAKYQTISQ